jgi:quercetin dioxygenase-like cupin family protein
MKKNNIIDSDLESVLRGDGMPDVDWDTLKKYENITNISLKQLREDLGMGSWAARTTFNTNYQGVVIQQQPGEGNRKHNHPEADENWIIMDGEFEWWIDGQGTMKVKTGDIVNVAKGTWHQITCISETPAVRYAINWPDGAHIYEENDE